MLSKLLGLTKWWLVCVAACMAGLAAPASAAPCATTCLASGTYDLSLTSGGYLRRYRVHVPSSCDGQRPVALALDLHGHALTMTIR